MSLRSPDGPNLDAFAKASLQQGKAGMTEDRSKHVHLGRAICGELEQAERREWWLANGLGGYAGGTVAGSLTRRYHGLLIAPVTPPLGRHLVLAKADAVLIDGERRYPLHTNRWASGVVSPAGHNHIESFTLDGSTARWRYRIADLLIEQRIWMEPGAHTTYVDWCLVHSVDRRLQLELTVLANNRDHHAYSVARSFEPILDLTEDRLRVTHADSFDLHLRGVRGSWTQCGYWIENMYLPAERERGLPEIDNHLCVGKLMLDLTTTPSGLVASLERDASVDLEAARMRRRVCEQTTVEQAIRHTPAFATAPPWIEQLAITAAGFCVARPLPEMADGESVIAGYPWFGDWGRDTMIALPGLTLVLGQHERARRILETFALFADRGMLPNDFPGSGRTPEYNTIDTALWYFEAWRAYLAASDDVAALARVYPALVDMIEWYVRGTRYGIGVDPVDGLVRGGEPGVQLTWMDARVDDWVVTPRIGKPVEINALWYNALVVMGAFAERLDQSAERYHELAARARSGFDRFIKPEGGLYDVLDGPEGDDPSVRPNQILAVSLPYSPLDVSIQRRVLDEVAASLLTTYGLRSLSPEHPSYRPRYGGGVWERDGAYHQGTVWAWLLPHYALADYRVNGDAGRARALLEPFADHLLDAGLGSISEIFDGEPPHRPRGAPSQAWSVACLLQAWVALDGDKG